MQRQRGYQCHERVTPEMMVGYDAGQLLCNHSRIVTDRGVYVCPILIDSPDCAAGRYARGGAAAVRAPASGVLHVLSIWCPLCQSQQRSSRQLVTSESRCSAAFTATICARSRARGCPEPWRRSDLLSRRHRRVWPTSGPIRGIACATTESSASRGITTIPSATGCPIASVATRIQRDNHFAALSYDYTLTTPLVPTIAPG